MPEVPDHRKRLEDLRGEVDKLREEIDAARVAALERRKLPDRRRHPRHGPDRRDAA